VTADVRKESSDLEGLVVSKIKALNAFKSVQLQSGPAAKGAAKPAARTLLVKVVIAHVKKVGGTKRFMLGVGAGRASMTTEITFVQARTGEELGSYSVTGESGGSAFSGGTSDAVQKTAEGIADVISKSFAGKGSGASKPVGN
jgi:hypothetical protein